MVDILTKVSTQSSAAMCTRLGKMTKFVFGKIPTGLTGEKLTYLCGDQNQQKKDPGETQETKNILTHGVCESIVLVRQLRSGILSNPIMVLDNYLTNPNFAKGCNTQLGLSELTR